MKNEQFPAVIQLSSLNGQNGFKLDGEAANDQSGWSVNTVGDFNGDGYDEFILGAPYHNSNIGRSYVIFGSQKAGSEGLFALSELNGVNGFRVDGQDTGGEGVQEETGTSVSYVTDFNGDGYSDVVLGAPSHYFDSGFYSGISYLIFGGAKVGTGGLFSVANINGVNGFAANSNNYNYKLTMAVSGTGDFNGDGYGDLLVGEPWWSSNAGRSFLVFGTTQTISQWLPLQNLNGTNGIQFSGETDNDQSGKIVSAAGDINGDGLDDFLIGAPYNSDGGRSYIVFGTKNIVTSGLLSLTNLNGANGFKIIGEQPGDQSGLSLDSAGDVNGDGYDDIIVGAPYHSSGRSYVIFGASDIGSSSLVSLGGLDGNNGFKIDGEADSLHSGWSVSGAGDFNGDGYDDLIIGAPNTTSATPSRSYIVFGGAKAGSTGLISLAGLDGSNGFRLDGEITGDECGFSVHGAGDVNGDGCDDVVISAPFYNNKAGRSYLVFGDSPPVLVNNSLSLYSGEAVILTAENLAAIDRNHNNDSLVFVPSNVAYGQFESVDAPGFPVTNFTQSQIWQGEIQFVQDGSFNLPAYNISVYSTGIASTGPQPANISMAFLRLDNNQLVINQGETVFLTSKDLSADNMNGYDNTLIFILSNIQQGHFELTNSSGQAITTFKQQDITDQAVIFIHDNSINAPAYQTSVTNGAMTTTPASAIIDFDTMPILKNNQLIINQGETLTFSSDDLSADHPNGATDTLVFLISALQHGYFELSNATGKAIVLVQV